MGWDSTSIGLLIGVQNRRIQALSRGEHAYVRTGTADKIRAVYDRLSGSPGPSNRVAAQARFRGYAPPIDWDEHRIEDPKARPYRRTTPFDPMKLK